ncbi:hypothetical protein ID866_1385 [Astraeus odoratus]|nr:hypothetical protein ID866_1385 [Astraeus odoratus]
MSPSRVVTMRGLSICWLLIGLTQAANVYLSPPEQLPSRLSSKQASQVLAAHLGLDQFEQLTQESTKLGHLFRERDFVASGNQNALLLIIDETYASDVLPSTLEPNFSFSEPNGDYLPTLLKTYNQRATHAFSHIYTEPSVPSQGIPRALDIFSALTPANEAFLAEMTMLMGFIEAPANVDRFAGLQLTGIPELAAEYGQGSEQYELATRAVRAAIESILSERSIQFALLSHAPSSIQKRAPQLLHHTPISRRSQQIITRSAGVCYSSDTIREGEECFACACETTTNESGQTQTWVGQMCERKDISGPFVLLTGTVVTLLLLMGGSVSLLYTIGSQELPSILTGGIAGAIRKE